MVTAAQNVKVWTTKPGPLKRLAGMVFFLVQKIAIYLQWKYSNISCGKPVEWTRYYALCCHEFSCCQCQARLCGVARMLPEPRCLNCVPLKLCVPSQPFVVLCRSQWLEWSSQDKWKFPPSHPLGLYCCCMYIHMLGVLTQLLKNKAVPNHNMSLLFSFSRP